MDIFKWLDDASLVVSYKINDFRKSDTAFYLNLQIIFIDTTILSVREYVDESHRKYAFHWQTATGDLIVRWDNAPHFPNLTTFPHHKHLASGSVVDSHDVSFQEVMQFIASQ